MRASRIASIKPPVSFYMITLVMVMFSLVTSGVGWGQTVSLQAQVIYASNGPGGVDSRLGTLRAELQKSLPYKSYELLDTPRGSAGLHQAWRAQLPDNRWLEITPTAVQEGQYSVTVRVLGPSEQQLVNTAVRLRRGSTFLISKGTSHKDGVLIIAISAN